MKVFCIKFASGFVAVVAVASLICGFSGCQTIESNPATAQVIVSYATMKYIEVAPVLDQPAKAARVRAVVDTLASIAQDDAVSISMLVTYAMTRIPANIAASDRALATALIQIAAKELQKKLGPDNAQIRIRVAEVLKWVSDACDFYAPRAPVAWLNSRWVA